MWKFACPSLMAHGSDSSAIVIGGISEDGIMCEARAMPKDDLDGLEDNGGVGMIGVETGVLTREKFPVDSATVGDWSGDCIASSCSRVVLDIGGRRGVDARTCRSMGSWAIGI